MEEKHDKPEIERILSNEDKRNTYTNNIQKYKRAVKAECFLEALMIDYACLEDRFRYLLFYLGVLSSPDNDKVGGKYTKNAVEAILGEYAKIGKRGLRTISGKRNCVEAIFLMLSDPEKTNGNNAFEKVLMDSLKADRRVLEVLELLDKIAGWCFYRNEVVHDLMSKRIDSLDMNLAEQAIYGNELFRKMDNMVRWIKRKQISKKISIEITKSRKQGKRRLTK